VTSFIKGVHLSKESKTVYRVSRIDVNSWIKAINTELKLNSKKRKYIGLRLVNSETMKKFNKTYRGNNNPTNVLAFPNQTEGEEEINELLGDIAICIEVLIAEAKEQNKNFKSHFVHLFVHGVLHLLGYKHKNTTDARIMEELEKRILKQLGIDDPYQ